MAKIKGNLPFYFQKSFIILLIISIGLVIGIYGTSNKTQTQQNASEDIDLNTSQEISDANNPDWTMGPTAAVGNFSNTLPVNNLGQLSVQIIDHPKNEDHGNKPTFTLPTQSRGNGPQNKGREDGGDSDVTKTSQENKGGGPANIKALNLTICKAEVHLAHLLKPGENDETVTDVPNDPKGVDKWETLQLDDEGKSFDLFKLASGEIDILGLTSLAAGKYTEIRLYIESANVVLDDGQIVGLTIPGKNNIVRIVRPFTITTGQTTVLKIDFNAQKSVIQAGNKYLLKPVIARILIEK